MRNKLLTYVVEKQLFTKNDKILVATSGGIDSMVLLDLLIKTGFQCAMLHVNFKLRIPDADLDEQFVQETAKRYGINCFVKTFDTRQYAADEKLSIQEAARNLRYEWFEKIRVQENYDFVVTAHHQNDMVETFLLNLTRGTGIRGLTGIPLRNKQIIRPLLFCTRADIVKYAQENNIESREDKSNNSNNYTRNNIRNKIIPFFEKINPDFTGAIIRNIQHIEEIRQIYFDTMEKDFDECVIKMEKRVLIHIPKIKELKYLRTFLFEILNPFHFSSSQVENIFHSLDAESGKQFFSQTHRLIKDREYFILTEWKSENEEEFYIFENLETSELPFTLECKILEKNGFFNIPRVQNVAALDFAKLKFPLILRKWQNGDYFTPLGMNGRKKLSDFFIDNKLSILDKENIWILESNRQIVWVVGIRISEHFKVLNKTEKILLVKQC